MSPYHSQFVRHLAPFANVFDDALLSQVILFKCDIPKLDFRDIITFQLYGNNKIELADADYTYTARCMYNDKMHGFFKERSDT